MGVALPPENRGVAVFLKQALAALAAGDKPRSSSGLLEEFDDCRYFLELDREAPEAMLLSFAQAHALPLEATPAVRAVFTSVAQLLAEPRAGFQFTLQVSLAALLALGEREQHACIQQLARIRLIAAGASLRRVFEALADGTCQQEALTVLSRPHAPFFVCAAGGGAAIVLPVWHKHEEFAEARRAAGAATAPQCAFTHPGQAPPAELHPEQLAQLAGFAGGFLTLAVQPRHVASHAAREALAWQLLTFHAFLDLHLRGFKAALHACMRRDADALLQEVAAARARPRQPIRLARAAAPALTAAAGQA